MSNIPAPYQWVEKVPALPKMIALGLTLVGIKEIPGPLHNNPLIMGMAKDLSVENIYPNDEMAWCALSQSWICLKTGKPLPGNGKQYDLLRARMFLKWGSPAALPMFGDILVIKRVGGEHVCMYIGEDMTHYHVMGGNQSNSYGFMRIEKDRLIEARRFYSIAPPASVKQYILSPTGQLAA